MRPMSAFGISKWIPLLFRFSAGQSVILAINLITGFLILRFLSISEYAIYIVASMLQTVVSLGTDRGMSQGVVTIGAPVREDAVSFGALVSAALRLRARLFLYVAPIVLVIAYTLLQGIEVHLQVILAVAVLALASGWVHQSGQVATAVLNANHDSSGLIRAGAAAALLRLFLVLTVCEWSPFAGAALVVNLIASFVHTQLLWRRCECHLVMPAQSPRNFSNELVAFMRPLLPGIIYYLMQAQIATILLALAGLTYAVAEVGALGRVGQIVGLLMLLNGFFVQPYFSRITSRAQYARRAWQLALLLAAAFVAVTLSAVAWPNAWLMVLGSKYQGLEGELVIALVGAQLSVAGAMLYSIVIASGRTSGQWVQIFLGVGAQILFLATSEINSTRAALVLTLLPAVTYVALQGGLVTYVLATWRENNSAQS